MDVHRKGLTGKGAAWAAKKDRGHRVLPESILREFDHAEQAEQAKQGQKKIDHSHILLLVIYIFCDFFEPITVQIVRVESK